MCEEKGYAKFHEKKKEMEGLYVRFKETDHPIWIGTHTYGMVKIRNGMKIITNGFLSSTRTNATLNTAATTNSEMVFGELHSHSDPPN
jgi:hypothetical protein